MIEALELAAVDHSVEKVGKVEKRADDRGLLLLGMIKSDPFWSLPDPIQDHVCLILTWTLSLATLCP